MNFHYQGALYETEELDLIKQHYTHGGFFVDIGANIGNHAIYISRFTKAPKIIVFEPNPTAISILKKNLALNHCKNVDTRFLGGRWELGKPLEARNARCKQPWRHLLLRRQVRGIEAIHGDSLLLNEPIAFIKIDVEGMEVEALSGCMRRSGGGNRQSSSKFGKLKLRAFGLVRRRVLPRR